MTEQGKRLLLAAREAILAEPEAFMMELWHCPAVLRTREGVKFTPDNPVETDIVEFRRTHGKGCGTQHCIAGWVIVQSGEPVISWGAHTQAKRLLGISDSAAFELFYSNRWPKDLATRYELSKSPAERAAIAALVIDDFIKRQEETVQGDGTEQLG